MTRQAKAIGTGYEPPLPLFYSSSAASRAGTDAPADSAQLVAQARQATVAFLRTWRVAWLRSDFTPWQALDRSTPRTRNARYSENAWYRHWCNYAWKPPQGVEGQDRRSHLIPSVNFPSLICPTWSANAAHDADASVVIDSALTLTELPAVVAARDSLITLLREAVSRLPADEWLRGQYVRFLVDQGFHARRYHDEALAALQSCLGDRWWCGMLSGYVLAHQGQSEKASIAFAEARGASPGALRCQVDNVVGLMDRRAVPNGYTLPTSCAEHAVFARTLWWLADPFWSDTINERQIEHDVRTTKLLLVASLPVSEHFDWGPDDPTDAVGQLVTRYLWPSKMFWSLTVQNGGVLSAGTQRSRPFVVGRDPYEQAPSPPLTSQEYTFGRVHVVPEWVALFEPLRAPASGWQLHAQKGDDPWKWWPFEHARLPRALAAVTDWQEQQWRRPTGTRLAIAARLPTRLPGGVSTPADSLSAHLIAARSPISMRVIDQRRVSLRQQVIMAGTLTMDSAVVSLELRKDGAGGSDARTRFGLTSEPSLASLVAGEVALAQPALLIPGVPAGPLSLDSVEARLLPSTTLRAAGAVGLYLESYGFAASDSVHYELHVERLNRRGVFERLTVALGGGRGDVTDTRIRWTDRRPGEVIPVDDGMPSIHGRYLTLSTATLPPGDYALTISLRTDRGAKASRSRLFRVSSSH